VTGPPEQKEIPPADRSTVFIRLPNWVGDAVMATCVLRCVRMGAPGGKIIAAGRPKLAELLNGSGFVDEFLPLRTETVSESIREGLRLRGCVDLALVLPNSFRSAVLPFVAGAKRRIGYAQQGRAFLLTCALKAPPGEGRRRLPEPMPTYWRRLTEAVPFPWQGDHPELTVTEKEREAGRAQARTLGIEEGEKLVGLSPGAAYGPSKIWEPGRFAAVAAGLYKELGLRAVVFVAPGEEPLAERITSAASSPIISTAASPLSLGECKAFLERCAVLITADSGMRHIAVALGIPTVTIIGPTDPRYTAYCLERQEVVAASGVECLGCHKRVCPTDHRCMTEIAPETVLQRTLELLRRVARRENAGPKQRG